MSLPPTVLGKVEYFGGVGTVRAVDAAQHPHVAILVQDRGRLVALEAHGGDVPIPEDKS